MLRLRLTSDCHPRTRNGRPHHSTTGEANASSTTRAAGAPSSIPPIDNTSSGTVSTTLTSRRRLIARSSPPPSLPSRSSSVNAATVAGSNAMPHCGQLLGSAAFTSGCIGQV